MATGQYNSGGALSARPQGESLASWVQRVVTLYRIGEHEADMGSEREEKVVQCCVVPVSTRNL
jgi:hypothetical protein